MNIERYSFNIQFICAQVGIELIPRDFDMDSPEPFRKTDVVSLVPVHKVMDKRKDIWHMFYLNISIFLISLSAILRFYILNLCSKQHVHLLMEDNFWSPLKQL